MTTPASTNTTSSGSSPRTPSVRILTPESTPAATPQRSESATRRPHPSQDSTHMDGITSEKPADEGGQPSVSSPAKVEPTTADDAKSTATPASKTTPSDKRKTRRKGGKRSKKVKKQVVVEEESSDSSLDSSDEDSSDDEEEDNSDSSSESSDSSSSDDNRLKSKSKSKKARSSQRRKNKKAKSKKSKGSRRAVESDSESDESDSASSSETESSADERTRRRHKKKSKSRRKRDEDDIEHGNGIDPMELKRRQAMLRAQLLLQNRRLTGGAAGRRGMKGIDGLNLDGLALKGKGKGKKKGKRGKVGKRATTLEYKRVDQLWDSTIHNYKLTESAEDQEDEFDQYVFTVRRKFDWENKYKNTVVDIKSKLLRDALQEVMKEVKGVSLVEDQPSVDPNMLFLYLTEIRTYAKKTLKAKVKAEKKRKNRKKLKLTIAHLKVLLGYLDQDYEETKKTLYPMLEAGNITFDLLWALFKPNTIAYTPTYGSAEHPRCFKVDYANKEQTFMRGEFYSVEGRYLEYDGKSFGLGDFEVQVDAFKGPRKITSLATYPLQYHRDPAGVKKQLIERGKKFVSLSGMNYQFHKGLAFMKKKKIVAKVNINGRIMIDPAIFRRINPNYPISLIKPKDADERFPGAESEEEEDSSDCGCEDSEEETGGAGTEGRYEPPDEHQAEEKTKFKVIWDKDSKPRVVEVPIDDEGREVQVENIDKLAEDTDSKQHHQFSEEELLISSPVVLGFAFSEKLWLEFTLEGVREIEWNDGAFESLVLPANQKSIVKALVESHKFHASKTIDDVVQGKGRGLCAVLHGPPGTGKTLTAEGIAELLRCPLYGVTAGELGTDPRMLEHELQKILDIAHSWGAVLLLDEADVFLEKREVHDIHRNALVSIFLRLLEYFQGILFLTTNRVETFDDAFQSRIHVALRYGELTTKAKKAVWKMFLERVRLMEDSSAQNAASTAAPSSTSASTTAQPSDVTVSKTAQTISPTEEKKVRIATFTEADFDRLARNNLNGRQIKNAVRTAQALAINEDAVLGMEHIKRVLEVAESFEKDLKGGTGYDDAMRSYT